MMGDMEMRESDSSGTTAEDLDEYEEPGKVDHYYVQTHCDLTKGDILHRYRGAARRLSKQIDEFHMIERIEMYNFQPVLVAKGVQASILEELPTLVGDKHVKAIVEDGDLWITNLSTGGAHGAGVSDINNQAGAWSNLLFDCRTDAVISSGDGRKGCAPDLVIQVTVDQRQQRAIQECLVIIELEVSNRSIRQMRQDYLRYFNYEPTLYSVVGIKMLAGGRHTPCQRALAVQWTRLPQGGVVEAVGRWDFGMLKISHSAGTMFSEAIESALPPVARAAWAEHRYVPVPMTALPALPHDAPNPEVAAAVALYIAELYAGQAAATLYGGVPPRVRFDANVLNAFRHNIPAGEPALRDFVLDLGRVFFVAQRTAPPP